MTDSFEAWLNSQMSAKGIRSARRLGLEAGIDPDRVADWMLGDALPSDSECDKLGAYLGVPSEDIKERRMPRRR